MQIVHTPESKTVTIIGDGGVNVTVTAASTLNLCSRKDGGLTVWYDGKSKRETVRVDKTGVLMGQATKGRKPKARKKS